MFTGVFINFVCDNYPTDYCNLQLNSITMDVNMLSIIILTAYVGLVMYRNSFPM